MADLSKLRFNGTDYNVKDASAPLRKFTNYSKTGNLPITSDDTTQTAIGKLEKAIDDKINTSAKGIASGVAELDANGKVPSSQLPSYVDDVLEYSAKSSFPATGETGKIYVDTTTNKTYRWSGSAYVEISESLALGETSSTAYRGDRGKVAYDHSQITNGNPHGTTGANTKLTGYSKGSSKDAVAATDTVNAAIAKHENRINANQSNILYAINTGVKNILPVDSCNVSEATYLLRDYEMNVPAGDYIFYINVTSTTATGIQVITSIGADDGQHRTGVKTINLSTGTGVKFDSMTILAGTTCITLFVNNAANIPEIMLCPKQLWDTLDHTFQHGALPNYDLTRLESEDRAALIECVDNGAKNVWDIAHSSYNNIGATFTTSGNSYTFTANGSSSYSRTLFTTELDAGNYVISATISNYNTPEASIGLNSDTQGYDGAYGSVEITANGTYTISFSIPSKRNIYIGFVSNNKLTYNAGTFTASNIMICTKAAFGVSKAFVPYRPSYQALVDATNIEVLTSSDVFTPNTNYTVINDGAIYKQGKHIFGNLTVSKSDGNFNTAETPIGQIKTGYRPAKLYLGNNTTFNTSQWGVNGIGYCYIPASGATVPNVIVKTSPNDANNYNVVVIRLDYCTP